MPLHIASHKPAVVWNGSFFVHHSLALVNRELTLAMLSLPEFAEKFDLSPREYEARTFSPEVDSRFASLAAKSGNFVAETSVEVRHFWPPDFTNPAVGRLALFQPWEFGSLPGEWVAQIERSVDEVWAYTHYVRQCYLESGVPADRVKVVPLGVNPQRFHPNATPFDFGKHPGTRSVRTDDFKFLFVGGTIPRKGIDVLLDAFDRTFHAGDSVTLIIKDFGGESFYANQNASLLIRALQSKPGGARICYLTEEMSEDEIAGLYAACDCLVHPYRGEGYGLPIAEAMACGKPAIVTGSGAALDFVTHENGYLIAAEREYLEQTHIGGMETVSRPFWAAPERESLESHLRHVVNHREEARAKGAVAARDIAARHTWAHAAGIASARLCELAEGGRSRAIMMQSLPLGLASFGLSAANGLELPQDLTNARYEERKQAALTETRASDWEHAVDHLEACLHERPNDWDAINSLAVAQFRLGDQDTAVALLRRGVAECPKPRDFHHNLAFVLLSRETLDATKEALDHALRAYHCTPDDPQMRRTLERAVGQILPFARRILRDHPKKQRLHAKRDKQYRELMAAYRRAQQALGEITEAAATDAAAAPGPKRPRLSVVMIVKNEERFLRNCLRSVQGIADEIVIVDTGSTDSTPQIAREFGAKVVDHVWKDDFAEARNVSLAHATGDWALWLDADEEIAPGAAPKFRAAIETAEEGVGGFMVEFHNWLQSPVRREGTDMAVHHACRLFRLVPGARFEGRIHEQNLRSLQDLGYHYAYVAGLTLDHFGYASEIMTTRNKHERFIRMLTREVEECPDPTLHHFHLFNLGNAYFTLGNMENAAKYLRRAAEQPDIKEEFTTTLFTELATALNRLDRAEEGLEVCAQADRIGIEQSGVEFARGYCYLHLLRYHDAEHAFRTALRLGQTGTPFAKTGDLGVSTYKAHYGLALALVGQERYTEARSACESALRGQPGFTEAQYLFAIVLLRLQCSSEARKALETVLEQAPDHIQARKDLGDLHYQAENYSAALPHLEQLAQINPGDYDAQSRLAVCYERTHRLAASRIVYERLRLLAPGSAEICVNLGRVLEASGNMAEALDCFAEAIHLEPKYSNAYFNAGDLLYRLGYFDRAAETYTYGLELNPGQPSGFFVLGNCLLQTQKYQAAVVSYRQELAQNPGHKEARHNLEIAESLMVSEKAA